MNVIILLIILLLGIFITILTLHFTKDRFVAPNKPIFNGLCLFDIDGTLTTGTQNEEVVQYCIDKGYAVGVATAGSIYTPANLQSYKWMPNNLYDFMNKHDFDTFNNVASGVLNGIHNPSAYNKILKLKPQDVSWPGWFKGFALERTGSLYDIKDPSKLFLFDNDPNFIMGVKYYNHDLRVVCSGQPCNGSLTLKTIKKYLL